MIDGVQLNFDENNLWVLNLCLAIIMFGVALELNVSDFKRVLLSPKSSIVGLVSQFILLPAVTFVLIIILKPSPSLALGMILVSCCPGGNLSNFMTHLAGGNSALSVSLTAVGTLLAIVATPLNFEFWGSMYEPTAAILKSVSINPIDMIKTIVMLAGVPIVAGMLVNHFFSGAAKKMSAFVKPLSILMFAAIVVIAFAKNYDIFLTYIDQVVFLVFLHNLVALATGLISSRLAHLSDEDQKTIAIETGIQNSGLGLLLIFGFFNGLGGMAIVAGWWGIWHIISGVGVAYLFSNISFSTVKN